MSKENNLKTFQERLGVLFDNEELLRQALIHRSYLNENPDESLNHNERLEYLGDAVLELVVSEYLYKEYPNPEGDLTTWRASLVNTLTMAEVAAEIGLNDYLFLSRGESKDTGRARQSILADALEAVIGSIYLDQGYEAAGKFIKANILSRLPNIIENKLYRDAKSLFQEYAQEHENQTPTYKVQTETGPDHSKEFTVGVYLGRKLIAEGNGSSKQEAEQDAAKKALEAKGWN